MKYGHEYKQLLASEGFPAEWVCEAVSYRELKKCIKKVQQELLAFGLDADTLHSVPAIFGVGTPPPPPPPEDEDEDEVLSERHETPSSFVPELWVAVDKESGSFVDAGLTQGTKDHFSRLRSTTTTDDDYGVEVEEQDARAERRPSVGSDVRWVNVPLSTAATFFDLLDPRLARLDALQQQEEKRLEGSIISLGNAIEALTHPIAKKRRSGKFKEQTDTGTWREILALYIDSAVFFSTYEQDHGTRTFTKAKAQLQQFSDTLLTQNLASKLKSPQSAHAFSHFISINLSILKAMRFQELNNEAVRKILKKLDKRTSLGAAKAYKGKPLSGPFAKSIATDMCAAMSSNVVCVVPQTTDFICPVCYGFAWRPIRLGCCSAIYCIRCVIRLQKEAERKCPMCREATIQGATAENIDDVTAAYLCRYFPSEVKERQRENERAATVDRFGEGFYRPGCAVM
ncbi:hypothetical protein AAFC00_006542 [Neodothiora populina]|uniref:RING-14 protein n=1 Tax=Neodothiora populina TaxID=2781224 RepID=A0ABR3PAA7_9PEZI